MEELRVEAGKRKRRERIPRLPAFRLTEDGVGFYAVWCSHCQAWHLHSPTSGARRPHCGDDESPYRGSGYILQYAGLATPEIIRWIKRQ